MSVQIIMDRDIYLDSPVTTVTLTNPIYAGDADAQRIRFRCFQKHGQIAPMDLSEITITAHFIRPDGGDVVITGTGGSTYSYVDLPEACYVYPGIFKLLVRASTTNPDVVTSVLYVTGRIDKPTTDVIIDPGTTIPSLEDLLAQIDACEAAEEAANAAAASATAAAAAGVRTDTDAQGLTDTQKANARTNIGAADAADVSQLSEETEELDGQIFITSYNLVDPDPSKWQPKENVTVTALSDDTIRVATSAPQTYASAFFDIDVTNISTLFASGGGYTASGDGVARARIYSKVGSTRTNLGPILTAGSTFDVRDYDTVSVELNATAGTAGVGYVDYTRVLVADSSVELPYMPYGKTSKIEELESGLDTAMDYVITAPSKEFYAHRGARLTAPENTMPAFILARQLGYRFVETDVRYTSDGVPVLIHDGTINRTARNADGSVILTEINIADITYEQALTYDFGIYKGQQYAGTKIPTLAEFLAWCKMTGEIPMLEQKIRNLNEVDAVISALQAAGITEHFVSLSQGIGSLERIYNSLPGGKFMYLINTTVTADDIRDAANSVAHPWIMSNYELLTDEIVTACRNSGVKLGTGLYTKFSDIYNTNDYSVAYIVEENTI